MQSITSDTTTQSSPTTNLRKRPLWRVALLIMLIVFGPALLAWILTLGR